MVNRNRIYTIMLISFAILVVWLRIDAGPPTVIVPAGLQEQSPSQPAFEVLAFSYEACEESPPCKIEMAVEWDVEQQLWLASLTPEHTIDQTIAQAAAASIANVSLYLEEAVQFDANTNLVQYGLTSRPRYILSYLIRLDTLTDEVEQSAEVELITLFIGSLNPTQTGYYALFVDEERRNRRGEWVYLIEKNFIDYLNDVRTHIVTGVEDSETPEVSLPTPSG